jgi:hypothetical protein
MSGIIGDNVGRGSGVTVAPSGGLEAGTKTDFFQASAPTDWTQDTANNDKQLRVVSGTGGGTGGTAAVSTPAHNLAGSHNLSAAAHTLTESEMPSHSHPLSIYPYSPQYYAPARPIASQTRSNSGAMSTSGTGGGSSHSHNLSGNVTVSGGSITAPLYMDVIIAERDA